MDFTKNNFQEFREKMTEVLKPIEEKFKLKIDLGNITYSSTDFGFKVSCTKADAVKCVQGI